MWVPTLLFFPECTLGNTGKEFKNALAQNSDCFLFLVYQASIAV